MLVLLQEQDKRRPFNKESDNEPTMVWLPPRVDQHKSAAAAPTQPARATAPRRAPVSQSAPTVGAPLTAPNQPQPPDVDWSRELSAAAMSQLARNEEKHQRESMFTAPRAPPSLAAAAPRPPEFPWDYAATHRIEHTPGGTLYININDRCLFVFPILVVCRIGEITPHTHLFDHASPAGRASAPAGSP